MPDTKKQSRSGRPPAGDAAKKVVSLSIDPVLIERIDAYAADNGISRSAAIETVITGLLSLKSPIIAAEKSAGQSDSCMFASPSLGAAILY